MGCSESKNIVEPDSKKLEEKPKEKTAIVPVTSKNAKIQTDEIPESSKMTETEAHMPIEMKAKIVAAKNIQTDENFNFEFPQINLTAADFAPENNVADLYFLRNQADLPFAAGDRVQLGARTSRCPAAARPSSLIIRRSHFRCARRCGASSSSLSELQAISRSSSLIG